VLDKISETNWRILDDARCQYMQEIEDAVLNGMSSTLFNVFDAIPEGALEQYHTPYPVLGLYDHALDKILAEIPQTAVPEGTVVLWHLYNMGYVIKTPRQCFGIDLHHRRAQLLAPYLDFLLVTHNHADHYNLNLLEAMADSDKKICSAFYPAPGFRRDPGIMKTGDVTITTEASDHNDKLPGFITTYLLEIGTGRDACVIYHTGDSRNPDQLNPGRHIHIWINHPRVGLDVVKTADRIRPDWIFYSHMLEMGHCKPCRWRPVNFTEILQHDLPECARKGIRGVLPLWGEKIVWKAGEN